MFPSTSSRETLGFEGNKVTVPQFKRLLKRDVQGMAFVENSFFVELFFTISAL